MSLLDNIQTAIQGRGRFFVDFGNSGAGKTSTLSQAPNTLLVQVLDNTADALKDSGAIPENVATFTVKDLESGTNILYDLANETHPYKNIILDGSSGYTTLVDRATINTYFSDKPGNFSAFGGFEGEAKATIEWQKILDAIENLVSKGLTVHLVCHSMTVPVKNAQGDDYVRVVPAIGRTFDRGTDRLKQTVKIADAVLYFDQSIAVTEDSKATLARRVIRTNMSPSYEAKNRLGLPDLIEMGNSPLESAKNLHIAIANGKKKKQS